MKLTTFEESQQVSDVYKAFEFQKQVLGKYAKSIRDIEYMKTFYNRDEGTVTVRITIKGV